MANYHIARKYKLPVQFEMLELGVEGLESREEIIEELKQFDKIAETYRQKPKDPFEGKEFKPKAGTNPSLHSNWEWQNK